MDRGSSIKSMDSEREKFRTYVEKSGVMSALTDALVHLYEEPQRPPDALTYVRSSLGAHAADQATRCAMLEEKVKEQTSSIERLTARVKELETELTSIREGGVSKDPTPPQPQQQPPPTSAPPPPAAAEHNSS